MDDELSWFAVLMVTHLWPELLPSHQVACYDCSHWGRILVRGADRLRFLHNQSSNNLNILQPGQGCDTVILTSTARTIDLVTAWVEPDHVCLLVSPQRREFLCKWFDKYIFFGDQVEIVDITAQTHCWRLIGSAAFQLLANLGVDLSALHQLGDHGRYAFDFGAVDISFGCGLAIPGLTVIFTPDQLEPLQQLLHRTTIPVYNFQDWETLRIIQGRPAVEAELTDDYNPLEARLDYTISWNKGCYIGQETIARLNTYQGVKQYLWGLELTNYLAPGSSLYLDKVKVGVVTSCVLLNHLDSANIKSNIKAFGLGYIKAKAGGIGLQLQAGDILANVVDVPFLSSLKNSNAHD